MDTPDDQPTGLFAHLLKTHRTQAGLSQNRLAVLSGVAQSHISEMEKGNNQPTLPTIHALAGALNVHPAALIASDVPAQTAIGIPTDGGPDAVGDSARRRHAG